MVAEPLKTVRNVGLVGLAIAVLVCIGGVIMFRGELAGAVHLNTAQTQMLERLGREVPGATIEFVDVSARSAALVICVSGDTPPDEIERLQDAVWIAYVDAFRSEGMAISHVAVSDRPYDAQNVPEFRGIVDITTLSARTGRAPPALHSIYAANELFDPSTEAPPALDGAGD